MNILHKITNFIAAEQLFRTEDTVLVALSGGADSVALLRLLTALGTRCEAAHCNFHLRGEESERDELFVRTLCDTLHIPLHVVNFRTANVARERGISIEMAARELRYEWFETLRRERGAAVIAVAHHRDDSVETLLINLMRGAGIHGMSGIRPRNGHVVRPLLCVDREEILTYLEHIGQPFVTDSTNLQDTYVRNKVRLRLLPLMEEINPSVRNTLAQTAVHLDEAAVWYEQGINEARLRVMTPEGISIPALLKEPAPRTLLFELLRHAGFNSVQVEELFHTLTGQSGKSFRSPTHRVVKDRTLLLITPLEEEPERDEPPFTLHAETVDLTPRFIIPRMPYVIALDADLLTKPLTLRRYRAGDSFVPFGMKGHKLISDYLTDRKYSLLRKEQTWVLCHGEDIVWLVGERIDNRYRVSETTRRVYVVERIDK
jgi:tRNA(Ile)-lysidine synthase